ncbi:MAG: 1-deoxy-D-xylulose-5-phosphate reductoisomerase [Gammaproteobacteria bacterium]|nr:MAG: 1-deoxy-D-xylulose-5-phosphate reductoisomerase [Gammaproteobacteria bacterium]
MKQITILGATGSIGSSTLDVIARHPDKYTVYALTANTNVEQMARICSIHNPRYAVMGNQQSAAELTKILSATTTEVVCGDQALAQVAEDADVEIVVAAIVGSVGLMPTLAAVRAGKRVLLANKESLVMAGSLFMDEVVRHAAELIPVDSEHNAIFQCLPSGYLNNLSEKGVTRILLTGSGGPFRELPLEEFDRVTPAQAVAHPNWDMGPKISVDSATMMNKGLELIEACWLFGMDESDIEIVLHKQSIVHSMVAYNDGSVLAQLGNPDMRTPIANALAWPDRISSGVESLDLLRVSRLDFEQADEIRFPCLRLARDAFKQGGTSMAILNAANEVAVENFLNHRIKFSDIPKLIEQTLQQINSSSADSLEVVLSADTEARAYVHQQLAEAGLRLSS